RLLHDTTSFPYTTLFRSGEHFPGGYHRNLWNNSSMGLLLANEQGEILTINPYLVELAGSASGSLRPNHVKDLFSSSAFGDLYQRSEEHTSELQSRENLVC